MVLNVTAPPPSTWFHDLNLIKITDSIDRHFNFVVILIAMNKYVIARLTKAGIPLMRLKTGKHALDTEILDMRTSSSNT